MVKIGSKEVLEELRLQISETPPESGGILGGRNGIVTNFLADKGKMGGPQCSYTPDTDFLNQAIKRWAEQGIGFMGMFHTHFGGAETLSEGDKAYIVRIMKAMPEEINCLYFPIVVMPGRRIAVHKAICKGGKIRIIRDEIEY